MSVTFGIDISSYIHLVDNIHFRNKDTVQELVSGFNNKKQFDHLIFKLKKRWRATFYFNLPFFMAGAKTSKQMEE